MQIPIRACVDIRRIVGQLQMSMTRLRLHSVIK